MIDLPLSDVSEGMPRTEYVLDSAHHGLAMNPNGTKLCAAGTMSDYAAIVKRGPLRLQRTIPVGKTPYWTARARTASTASSPSPARTGSR